MGKLSADWLRGYGLTARSSTLEVLSVGSVKLERLVEGVPMEDDLLPMILVPMMGVLFCCEVFDGVSFNGVEFGKVSIANASIADAKFG